MQYYWQDGFLVKANHSCDTEKKCFSKGSIISYIVDSFDTNSVSLIDIDSKMKSKIKYTSFVIYLD